MSNDAVAPALTIVAPMSGEVVDLADVPDKVFASKKMGDGFAVRPTGDEVVSPVDGKVMLVAATKHAVGIKTPAGLEVLVHLGIDTVELEGAPFDIKVAKGDELTAGQPLGTMSREAVLAAGKDTTAILVITNTAKKLGELTTTFGAAQAGDAVATATVKAAPQAAPEVQAAPQTPAAALAPAGAVAVPAAAGAVPAADGMRPDRAGLTGYDALAYDIIENVGGADNVRSVIHCITRVRFYLKDQALANDAVVSNLDGVIDVAKAGGQYQVVIGPAVEDVYEAIVHQLPQVDTKAEGADGAERPTTPVGWLKWGFSELIGVITGSMIPVIGLLAAAGILKGVLALLLNFHVITAESSTYNAINAMSDSVFFFLPIFVGFTAAKRLGADPIVVAIIGGVLTYPSIVAAAGVEGQQKILGMGVNADFFGIPYHLAKYPYSIFPIIVAAWLAARLEPWLKRVIPVTIRMIFVPLVEVFVVSTGDPAGARTHRHLPLQRARGRYSGRLQPQPDHRGAAHWRLLPEPGDLRPALGRHPAGGQRHRVVRTLLPERHHLGDHGRPGRRRAGHLREVEGRQD